MYITFKDNTNELGGVLQPTGNVINLTINGVEFECVIEHITTEYGGNVMHMGLQGVFLEQGKRTTIVECFAKNKAKAELSQAKEEVRKAQKAFKDAQRKLSELQKGSK